MAAAHAHAAVVIPASELNRIRGTLSGIQSPRMPSLQLSAREVLSARDRPCDGPGHATEQPLTARERAMMLHEKSKLRAKSWNNTLEGSRRKKAEERRRKTELEEIERQRIDAEEAKIQLDQRQKTIDRANKLLYDESDRMKAFHGKMMLCDVIAEREAQVGLKTELKQLNQIREDRFLEMEKQNYRKMLEREMKEKETKEALSRVAAKAQKDQLAEYKERRYREIEDQMLEGELLRRKAIDDLEDEHVAEQAKRGLAVAALAETKKANDYLRTIKDKERLRELEEEEKIVEYASRKEKMLQMRREREEEVFKTAQAARLAMIEAQSKRLAEMQNDEDERVERQVQAKEEVDEKRRKEKEEAMKRWSDDIDRSRAAQVQRKQAQRERERKEDADAAKFMNEWCKILDHQEQEEMEVRSAASRRLAQDHLKMAASKRQVKDEEKTKDLAVARHAKKALEADTAEFHVYAEECIRDYSSEGKNVIPLIKELRDFRKRIIE